MRISIFKVVGTYPMKVSFNRQLKISIKKRLHDAHTYSLPRAGSLWFALSHLNAPGSFSSLRSTAGCTAFRDARRPSGARCRAWEGREVHEKRMRMRHAGANSVLAAITPSITTVLGTLIGMPSPRILCGDVLILSFITRSNKRSIRGCLRWMPLSDIL